MSFMTVVLFLTAAVVHLSCALAIYPEEPLLQGDPQANHQLSPHLQFADAQRDAMNARIEADKERLKMMNNRKQYYDKKKKMNEYLLKQRQFHDNFDHFRDTHPWYNQEHYAVPGGRIHRGPFMSPLDAEMEYANQAYRKPMFKRSAEEYRHPVNHHAHVLHQLVRRSADEPDEETKKTDKHAKKEEPAAHAEPPQSQSAAEPQFAQGESQAVQAAESHVVKRSPADEHHQSYPFYDMDDMHHIPRGYHPLNEDYFF